MSEVDVQVTNLDSNERPSVGKRTTERLRISSFALLSATLLNKFNSILEDVDLGPVFGNHIQKRTGSSGSTTPAPKKLQKVKT